MKKTYLAGGVLAAFECKLTLTSAYVTRAAATARIIHAMARPRTGTPYDELVSPLVYGLLAHRTALTDEPEQRIDRLLQAAIDHDERPGIGLDLLCIADLATWTPMTTLMPRGLFGGSFAAVQALHKLPDEGGISGYYMRGKP